MSQGQIFNRLSNGFVTAEIAVFAILIASTACNSPSAVEGDGVQLDGPSTVIVPTQTAAAIRQLRPGMAVRGMACLSCHANINASVITDLGQNSPWFLDLNQNSSPSGLFGQAYYNPYTWQTLEHLNGQFVLPQATVPASAVTSTIPGAANHDMDLSNYLQSPNASAMAQNWDDGYWGFGPSAGQLAYTQAVNPGVDASGNPLSPIQTVASVYIAAPTKAQILALAPNPGARAPWVQSPKGGATPNGLTATIGVNGTSYIANTGPIQCVGQDFVINGTLLLNNALFYAGAGGCRLYVTGSVFIEGPITYLNEGETPDPTQNLQISSATSIIMGVGLTGAVYGGGSQAGSLSQEYSQSPLVNRLLDDARSPQIRSAPDAGSYQAWASSVMAEANNIGPGILVDASVSINGNQTAHSAAGQIRQAIDFDHLLLNAPVIQSRYLGTFNGVIVAEIAVFSLGEFQFNYDNTFANPTVPILPTLPVDILCAGDPAACMIAPPSPTPSPSPTSTPTPTPTQSSCSGSLCGGGILGI
jgi:hypothetical protein